MFEFGLKRCEALLPRVRDVGEDALVSMGMDGFHHLLESRSRDCIRFSQCSAGTSVADPAENVLLDVKEDAAADALCVSWFREGLADSHHGRE